MTEPWDGCIDCGHTHAGLPDDPRCNALLPVSDYRNGPEYCEHLIYADVLAFVKRREAEAASLERERLRERWNSPAVIDVVERVGWDAGVRALLAEPGA